MDLKKMFRKTVVAISAAMVFIMVGFVLIFTVLRPIMWLANMLGRIDEIEDVDPGWEEKIIDYREDLDELTEEDYIEHVYGFKVNDEIDRLSLGYTVKWKKTDPCIIISVNIGSIQVDKATDIMLKMLKDISAFRTMYLETHPYAESTD